MQLNKKKNKLKKDQNLIITKMKMYLTWKEKLKELIPKDQLKKMSSLKIIKNEALFILILIIINYFYLFFL